MLQRCYFGCDGSTQSRGTSTFGDSEPEESNLEEPSMSHLGEMAAPSARQGLGHELCAKKG